MKLSELLKKHIGETFYNPLYGDVKLDKIDVIMHFSNDIYEFYTRDDGCSIETCELVVFPSKEQRDWNRWIEEQKPKVPKTWDELCLSAEVEQIAISTDIVFGDNDITIDNSHAVGKNNKLAKSALALLKIHQLIEVGYGGNITSEEWNSQRSFKYCITCIGNDLSKETKEYSYRNLIAFHTPEQREEFMSYSENVQLIKDYYMI